MKRGKLRLAAIAMLMSFLFSGCISMNDISNGIYCFFVDLVYADSFASPDEFDAPYTSYYYNSLSENEKKAYVALYNGVRDFEERIPIPSVTDEEMDNIFDALTKDDVSLFSVSNQYEWWSGVKTGFVYLSYYYTPEETSSMLGEVDDVADDIFSEFTDDMTDYDKELAIHDYIVANCSYDRDAADSYEDYVNAYTPYGALIEGRSVCEGYARAMAYLLNKCDIENYLVSGTGEDTDGEREGHMWLIVEIDGEKYHVDPTYDDPFEGDNDYISHIYFNLSAEEIAVNHFDLEVDDSDCTSDAANYFVRNDLLYSAWNDGEKQRLTSSFTDAMARSDVMLEFKFDTAELYGQALADLIDNGALSIILGESEYASGVDLDENNLYYGSNETERAVWVQLGYE